jgi:hypothetical protein
MNVARFFERMIDTLALMFILAILYTVMGVSFSLGILLIVAIGAEIFFQLLAYIITRVKSNAS